jgi:predicted dienelactone hydrolase
MRHLRELVLGSLCLTGALQAAPAHAVDNYQAELVDSARGNRKVGVNVFIPDGASKALPTLILSHGFGESYQSYDYLGEGLAERGYVVVVVNHVGSDVAALGTQRTANSQSPDNFVLRPQDVSFVLDRLLAGDPHLGKVVGRVDAERLAMAGHSLGSTTAIEIAGGTVLLADGKQDSFADPRFRAVIAMSPQIGARGIGIHPGTWQTVKIPALLMWGTKDRGFGALSGDPSLRMEVYDKLASAHKYAVVIEGAEHHAFTQTDPWYPGGKRNPRHHAWIVGIVGAFLDTTLLGKSDDALLHPTFSDAREGEIQVTSAEGGSTAAASAPSAAHADGTSRSSSNTPATNQAFDRMDRDGNGQLSKSEAPPRLAQAFSRIDANGDGAISREEFQALSARAGGGGAARTGGASGGASRTSRQEVPTAPVTENVAEAMGGQTVRIKDTARDRTITLDVYAPQSPSSAPALIISEYSGGVRQAYGDLASHWAGAGFIVLVPDHIDSVNEGGQRGSFAREHWPDRVADMAFLCDHLDEIAKLAGLASGAIARDKVGLVGHYLGSFAASVAAGARPPSGPEVEPLPAGRVGALLLLSPQGGDEDSTDTSAWAGLKVPMMVVTGAHDASARTKQSAEWRAEVYKRSPPPDKYLAWFDVLDSRYGGLFSPQGGSVTGSTLAQDVTNVTTTFLSAYLQGEKDALQALVGEHEGYRIESK